VLNRICDSESTAVAQSAAKDSGILSEGHRQRLLDRYLKRGIDALHPHEVLELLLTFSIRRKDTKKIAKTLLARFKSISGACNAPIDVLQEIDGMGRSSAALLSLVRDLLSICLKERYKRNDVIVDRSDVESYLRFCFGYRPDEFVAALYLDSANHVIQTEIVAEGTGNQCARFPRIVIERALRCHSAAMIIAHNHPGGTAVPSELDWKVTEKIFAAGRLLDIPLHDHIIICSDKVLGLRDLPRWPGRTDG